MHREGQFPQSSGCGSEPVRQEAAKILQLGWRCARWEGTNE